MTIPLIYCALITTRFVNRGDYFFSGSPPDPAPIATSVEGAVATAQTVATAKATQCSQCRRVFHLACRGIEAAPPEPWHCSQGCEHLANKVLPKLVNQLEMDGADPQHPQPWPASVDELLQLAADRSSEDGLTIRLLQHKGGLRGGNAPMSASTARGMAVWLAQVESLMQALYGPRLVDRGFSSTASILPLVVHSGKKSAPAAGDKKAAKAVVDVDFSHNLVFVMIRRGRVLGAAVLRVFGQELAEVPLIAAKQDNQVGQVVTVMRRLLWNLQGVLQVLGVQRLYLHMSKEEVTRYFVPSKKRGREDIKWEYKRISVAEKQGDFWCGPYPLFVFAHDSRDIYSIKAIPGNDAVPVTGQSNGAL
eukprot:jgi/Mesvir1/13556/Mv12445-RA.1